jgi:hypothetical protein
VNHLNHFVLSKFEEDDQANEKSNTGRGVPYDDQEAQVKQEETFQGQGHIALRELQKEEAGQETPDRGRWYGCFREYFFLFQLFA